MKIDRCQDCGGIWLDKGEMEMLEHVDQSNDPRVRPDDVRPQEMSAVPRPGDPVITPALVAEHGLTPDEYERLVAMLGRTPTFTELGHCQCALERTLLVQALASRPQDAADQGPVRAAGPR